MLWLVLGAASLVLMMSWLHMHHTVSSEHVSEHEVLTSSRSLATEQQLQQVQKLYDETRGLLATVLSGTSNASHAASLILQHSLDRMSSHSSTSSATATAPVESQLALYKQQSASQLAQIASLQASLADERKQREKLESSEFGAGKPATSVTAGVAPPESKWLVTRTPP